MAHNLLSEIHEKSNQWTICVVVSRMWHYRGGTDHGAIKHTDLVLLDKEGNHMYGQIPPEPASRFKDVLEEGKVYVIRKFFCNLSKPAWRPVESPFMVQFTRYTQVQAMPGLEEVYPFCTYSLTPFLDLPKPSAKPARFNDVIGKIKMVSDIIPIQSMYQTVPSDTRTVVLEDLLGNEISITLWGERAVEFDADAVRSMGEKEPVIAIFVGTLPKMTYGTRSLSGGSACRWYIDEDVPDINSFRASLDGAFVPLMAYATSGQHGYAARVQQEPVNATVLELTNLDPFEDMNKRFFCTVTVDRVTPDKRWFFASCSDCRKSARCIGNQYKCSNPGCHSTDADHAYCVSIMATDGTAEAKFVLFDKVAAAALGKSLVTLLQQRYPGCGTIEEATHAARLDATIPPDIARLVGQKYKLMVSISKKSQFTNTDSLSFQINRIEKTFKPELPPSVFGGKSLAGGSSSSSPASSGLVQIGSTYPSPSQSPVPQPHTPPPSRTDYTVLSHGKSSLGVNRGTRRTIFSTPSKSKENLQEAAGASSIEVLNTAATSGGILNPSAVGTGSAALQPSVISSVTGVSDPMEADVVPSAIPATENLKDDLASSVLAPGEKSEASNASKNKRVASGGKGSNSSKKAK